MKKVNWQLAERKMNKGIKAGKSFWDRIINDPDFVKARRELQARYSLPMPFDIRLNNIEWIKWMGYDEDPMSERAKRGQAFHKDVDVLLRKFDIPKKWHFEFFAEIAGESIGHADMSSSSQFPEMQISKNDDGTWKWTCIITPETDLDNPLTLYMIQREQKIYAGDPPKPAKDKKDRRKNDWRPVYEWYKLHPLFTIAEIAKKIGYSPRTVRTKLSEFAEYDSHK